MGVNKSGTGNVGAGEFSNQNFTGLIQLQAAQKNSVGLILRSAQRMSPARTASINPFESVLVPANRIVRSEENQQMFFLPEVDSADERFAGTIVDCSCRAMVAEARCPDKSIFRITLLCGSFFTSRLRVADFRRTSPSRLSL